MLIASRPRFLSTWKASSLSGRQTPPGPVSASLTLLRSAPVQTLAPYARPGILIRAILRNPMRRFGVHSLLTAWLSVSRNPLCRVINGSNFV